jgi:EthD domain
MTDAATPTKLVHLAPKPDGVDQQTFAQRWQARSERNMRLPAFERFTRYEHCTIVTTADDPSLPALLAPDGPSAPYGGVGAARFEGGAEALAAITTDPRGAEEDLETFGAPLASYVLATHDEAVFDHGGTELRIYSFLARQPGLSVKQFSEEWRRFIETFCAHEELTRHCSAYVQDHVLTLDPQTTPAFDGIAEMGFRSLEDVVAFLSEPSLVQELFPAEEPFIDRSRGLVLLTRPTVLSSPGP